ncbi:insulin-like growth factor-binding protein complex acid labile subunit isoform X2 [Anopheles albimanus]|nr:insulin-like growth factor-binding protein complex acid labile subunit isoform X2 [Anopheles albimanus]
MPRNRSFASTTKTSSILLTVLRFVISVSYSLDTRTEHHIAVAPATRRLLPLFAFFFASCLRLALAIIIPSEQHSSQIIPQHLITPLRRQFLVTMIPPFSTVLHGPGSFQKEQNVAQDERRNQQITSNQITFCTDTMNSSISFGASLLVLVLVTLTAPTAAKMCPKDCHCDLDQKGRYRAICSKVEWITPPTAQFDRDLEVLIINNARHPLVVGPTFQFFTKLEILRVVDSNVPSIGDRSFWGLVRLKTIDLSRNNITQLSMENFRGQDNLVELDLSRNRLERVASGTFAHLKELKTLHMIDSSINELNTRLFLHLAKLKYLDLSMNSIEDLAPEVFKDVQDLKTFKVRGCRLSNVNPQIYNILSHLTELDLGQNQFKFLDKEEFKDLRHLQKLRLDGNQLSVIVDELFLHQKGLTFLDISRNRLAKIADRAFENLVNLTFLDVSYNKLSHIEPVCLRPLRNLQTLNISGNLALDLAEMEDTIQTVKDISSLVVADLGSLPLNLFAPFKRLTALNLSGNHIDNITIQIIEPLAQLKFLDLSRNQLNGIPERYAAQLSRIADVKLENNPLICDWCHMGPLIMKAKKLPEGLPWQEVPRCFLPERLREVRIDGLDQDGVEDCMEVIVDEDHDAASTSHNFLEQAGSVSILAFFGLIVLILLTTIVVSTALCLSRHRARYYTHEDKRDAILEKHTETPVLTSGSEINFKFPYNERVCTIDEMCLPAPPPPPGKLAPAVIERFD